MRVYFYINYHICVEILDRIIRINGLILAVLEGRGSRNRARNKYEKKGQEKKKNYDRTIQ